MITELASMLIPVALGGTGWAVKKQLDINAHVQNVTARVDGMEDDVKHTRNRVDALYDHLIEERFKKG